MDTEQVRPKCRYCGLPVEFAPGFIMTEVLVGKKHDGFICHEECYQMSGEDDGFIERTHEAMEEL